MKLESQVVDAFREGEGPGILGRMLDILERHGHAVGATSVATNRAPMIDGSPETGVSRPFLPLLMLDIQYSSTIPQQSLMTIPGMVPLFQQSQRLADVMSTQGVPRVFDRNFMKGNDQQLREYLELLHSETDDNSGVFGDGYSQTFVDLWNSELFCKMPHLFFVILFRRSQVFLLLLFYQKPMPLWIRYARVVSRQTSQRRRRRMLEGLQVK